MQVATWQAPAKRVPRSSITWSVTAREPSARTSATVRLLEPDDAITAKARSATVVAATAMGASIPTPSAPDTRPASTGTPFAASRQQTRASPVADALRRRVAPPRSTAARSVRLAPREAGAPGVGLLSVVSAPSAPTFQADTRAEPRRSP